MYNKLFSIGISMLISLPFYAQDIVPVMKDSYPLREHVTTEFRSAQADLIKVKGFNPYAVLLKSAKGTVGGVKSVKSVRSGEELGARFLASVGNGYFFESFENAYGSRLPEGWTNHPSAANSGNIAFYWQAFSPRVQNNPDLQSHTVMSIEGLLSGNLQFDEMFQSPEIEIQPNSQLSFSLGFNPAYLCYIDFEKGTFDTSVKNADLQVNVTTDDGENYTSVFSLFDSSKGDPNFQKFGYRSYSADLSVYSGRKVRLAFRYTGIGVPRMDIDNVCIARTDEQEITVPALYNVKFIPVCNDADRYEWNFTGANISKSEEHFPVVSFKERGSATVALKVTKGADVQTYTQRVSVEDPLPVISSYKHPEGVYLVNTYESKVSPDGYLAPTDVKFRMANKSLFADTYEWDFGKGNMLVDDVSAFVPEVVSYLASNTQPCPSLNALNDLSDSTYAHSGNLYMGGNYLVWNIENMIGGQNGRAMQGLGSNSAYQFEEISEHYSRPLKDQFIGGVLLHFVIAQSNSDFTLTAVIRGLDSGQELGRSAVPKSKASGDGGYGAFFVFNFPALIKVSEPFAIEITGIPNGENEKLFFVNQYFGINGGKPFEDNTSFFKMKGEWVPANDLLGYATSLSISPLIISPVKDIYLKDESTGHYKPYNFNALKLSDAGGTLDIGVIATSHIKEKPVTDASWIRCASLKIQENQNFLTFSYDSKAGEDRQATIYITDSLGTTKEFIVYQGSYSGVAKKTVERTFASRNGNNVVVQGLLSSDDRIVIYDIMGRKIEERRINFGETKIECVLPNCSETVYIIRIMGDNPRSVKL